MISVVIPLYNKERFIGRAIQSVITQRYQDFELIIINDGSTDEGLEIAREFKDPRVRLFSQENHGVANTRNHGIKIAQGNPIAFLDADDEWLDNHLAIIAELYKKYPSAGAYATSHLICRPNGKMERPQYQFLPRKPYTGPIPHYFLSASGHDIPINSSVVAVPKEVFRKLGGFLEGEKWGEDTEMWGRIALHFDIIISSEIGAVWHQEAAYRTSHTLPALRLEPIYYTIQDADQKGIIPLNIRDDVLEYKAKKEIEFVEQAIYQGAYDKAWIILRNVRTKRFLKEKLFWIAIAHSPRSFYVMLRNLKRAVFTLFFKESYDQDPWI